MHSNGAMEVEPKQKGMLDQQNLADIQREMKTKNDNITSLTKKCEEAEESLKENQEKIKSLENEIKIKDQEIERLHEKLTDTGNKKEEKSEGYVEKLES